MSMRSSRRILLISPSLPHPPIWGSGIRIHQFVSRLAARHHVTLLAHAGPDDTDKVQAMRAVCQEVHTVSLDRPLGVADRRAQLASLVSPLPYQVLRLRSAPMQQAVDELLEGSRFDLVQVASSPLAELTIPTSLPVVLDEHNIEYELLQRASQAESSPLRRGFNWLEYRKFRRHEIARWEAVAGVAVTSEREEAIVRRQAPGVAVETVPNGVDLDHFRPDGSDVDPDSIVFSGLMRYRPNLDAAAHFAREVLPIIRRARPSTRFTVVGWGHVEQVRAAVGPGVEVTGRVPDVREHINRAAVVVVPLRVGGGTRLKVLEALACRRPVVGTSLGVEGIAVEDGVHLLIRDEPREFAEAVLDLLRHPDRGRRLAANGRKLVEEAYGWQASVERLERLHDLCLREPWAQEMTSEACAAS
ncbi:MAG TPA: glycosyltransferase family 4 protein [Candidatus Dormibacteraeota bacterium]